MFKQEGGFWLYFFGIIIMFVVLYFVAQSYMGRDVFGRKIVATTSPTSIAMASKVPTKKPTATTKINSTTKPNTSKTTPTPTKKTVTKTVTPTEITKDYYAEIKTNFGTIKVDLLEKNAPNTVANFINLANSNHYTNTNFFKLITGVLLQGGEKSVTGNAGYKIPDEINWDSLDYDLDLRTQLKRDGYKSLTKLASRELNKYALVMVGPTPNSASSQFAFILDSINNPKVNALRGRVTVFGWVIDDFEAINKISVLPVDNNVSAPKPLETVTIENVTIYTK
jgi:peptidyl-prolyl cis-trans isomerase B (cyclophilin B)